LARGRPFPLSAQAVDCPMLDHRRFLDHPPPLRVAEDGRLFARVGGQAAVDSLVDTLYDRLEADEVLRPLAHELAQAPDPATDAVEITPVHHAVAGGQVAALRLLLVRAVLPLRAGVRALRGAAARGSPEMVAG
jgi:hypothetical protein